MMRTRMQVGHVQFRDLASYLVSWPFNIRRRNELHLFHSWMDIRALDSRFLFRTWSWTQSLPFKEVWTILTPNVIG